MMKIVFCTLIFLLLLITGCSSVKTTDSASSTTSSAPSNHSEAALSLSDFTNILPGKSTTEDLYKFCPYAEGKRLWGAELYRIEYPDDDGNIFLVKYDEYNIIRSVTYTASRYSDEDSEYVPTELDPDAVPTKAELTLKDFEHIVLNESTYADLYQIYPQRRASTLGRGAMIEFPAENENVIYIELDLSFKVVSIEYTTK